MTFFKPAKFFRFFSNVNGQTGLRSAAKRHQSLLGGGIQLPPIQCFALEGRSKYIIVHGFQEDYHIALEILLPL